MRSKRGFTLVDLPAVPMSKRPAFTLVELLVVIGIIAVLVAMLLPTLNKARQAANRVVCLSNLQQLGFVMRQYAAAEHDQVPVGTWEDWRWHSDVIYYNQGPLFYTSMGLMYQEGFLVNPQTYYCPSMNDPRWQYNNPLNTWPPGAPGGSILTRISYASRPVVDWPPDQSSQPIDWSTNKSIPMPRLLRLKNKVVLADLMINEDYLNSCHISGVNVLYGDGEAQWVARAVIDQPAMLGGVPNGVDPSDIADTCNNHYLNRANENIDTGYIPAQDAGGAWAALDTQYGR